MIVKVTGTRFAWICSVPETKFNCNRLVLERVDLEQAQPVCELPRTQAVKSTGWAYSLNSFCLSLYPQIASVQFCNSPALKDPQSGFIVGKKPVLDNNDAHKRHVQNKTPEGVQINFVPNKGILGTQDHWCRYALRVHSVLVFKHRSIIRKPISTAFYSCTVLCVDALVAHHHKCPIPQFSEGKRAHCGTNSGCEWPREKNT